LVALFEAVRHGALGRRRTCDRLADQFLPGAYDPPQFALRFAHKDATLATPLGRELGVPPTTAAKVVADVASNKRATT
jgi:3-hydroxyisobutyrate dehydrogenase